MAKENYVVPLDNLLRRYNKDRQWLSILCLVPLGEMNKLLSSKKMTYGKLQDLLRRGGVGLTISIQGDPAPEATSSRMSFLQNNVRIHRNGSDILSKACDNKQAPQIWWKNDDITLYELTKFEKYFPVTFLWTFTGIGETPDVTKSAVEKGFNWKKLPQQTAERFRKTAIMFLKSLDPSERKKLLTRAVLANYDPTQDLGTEENVTSEPEEDKTESRVIKVEPIQTREIKIVLPDETPDSPMPERKEINKEQQRMTNNVTVRFKSAGEIERLDKIANEKGVNRNKMLYDLIVESLLSPRTSRAVQTSREPDSFKNWLNKQQKSLASAYLDTLKDNAGPWKEDETPFGAETLIALPSGKKEKQVFELYMLLKQDVIKGNVRLVTSREPDREQRLNILSNSQKVERIRLYKETLGYLAASGKWKRMPLAEELPYQGQGKAFVDAIECISAEGEENVLVLHGYEKKTFSTKRFSVRLDGDSPEENFTLNDWIEIVTLAESHYRTNAEKRTQEAVKSATDTMQESYDRIDSNILEFKRSFRLIIAELNDLGRADDFIAESCGKIYSKPQLVEGRATILITTDTGERRWNEDELPFTEILVIADAIKKHII